MRLSKLQKYILEKCYLNKSKGGQKVDFYGFYVILPTGKSRNCECGTCEFVFYPKKELRKNHRKGHRQSHCRNGASRKTIQDVVHKSLDSLVTKDLLVAFGRKTAKKWYVQKVRLTARGRKIAKELIKSKQLKLKIK